MTCDEFRELAALFALGALSPEEMAACEAHLREPRHDGCFEALSTASAGAEALARSLQPSRPDPRVWAQIEKRLGATRPVSSGSHLRERAAWAVAVAAALALFGTLLGARRDRRAHEAALAALNGRAAESDQARAQCAEALSSLRGEAEAQKAALALLASPSAQVVALAAPGGQPARTARVLVDLPQKKGMFIAPALAAQPGKDYELWVIRGEAKLAAGLLRAGPSGAALASIDPQLLGAPIDAVAVTLEPAGGGPVPRGPIVLVGTVSKT